MNIYKKLVNTIPAFVLKKDVIPENIAQAMIEDGHQKQPFYVFDMDQVYRRIQRFKSLMPRVDIFYAMKANDNEMMLKLAVAMGVGFDCASPGEIAKIINLNVSPRSIIYAMASKAPYQIIYAHSAGVMHTTFDSSYELEKIKLYWPDARLLLRVRVDGDSVHQLGEKFGCDYHTEAIELLEEGAKLGLDIIGVAFHVGSACFSMNCYVTGLQYARALFDHEERAGRRMKIVDIGGGFLEIEQGSFVEVCQTINRALEELFPDPEVQVIAEPGRYLCDTSFTLYCNISNASTVKMDHKVVNVVHMNDGIYGTMSYFESWYNIEKFQKTSDPNDEIPEETILIGATKDPRDFLTLSRKTMLPKLKIDDWLVVKRQGAYTFTMSKAFSSLELPLIRSVISLELWNKIKDCPVFTTDDFVMNWDISTPLPLTLPPVLPGNQILQNEESP